MLPKAGLPGAESDGSKGTKSPIKCVNLSGSVRQSAVCAALHSTTRTFRETWRNVVLCGGRKGVEVGEDRGERDEQDSSRGGTERGMCSKAGS